MSTPRDRLRRYLEYLDAVFGVEPEYYPFDSRLPGAPKVACMVYRDLPEPGCITGVTYGLSEVAHPEWKAGRPELTISVRSSELAWALAAGRLANDLRGECPFCYGDVINFGEPVAEDSQMSACFVFAPSILDPEAYLGIDVGGRKELNIAGVYPIYDSEREALASLGLEAFWHHPSFDPYDLQRPAASTRRARRRTPSAEYAGWVGRPTWTLCAVCHELPHRRTQRPNGLASLAADRWPVSSKPRSDFHE